MKLRIVVFIMGLCCVISCRSIVNLDEDDKRFIAYKGYELLVFKSRTGKVDTFTLRGFDDYYSVEQQKAGLSKLHIEHFNLMYEFGESKNGKDEKAQTYLIGLTALQENEAIVSFNILNPEKGYYFWNSFQLDSFFSGQRVPVKLGVNLGDDVMAIENKSKNYSSNVDSIGISRIYWSSLLGLVGYRLNNNDEFILVEKIVNN